jgi:outer membrane receptor protein involved in Fe transport
LENYDLRFDYEPYEGGLFSASWFYKDIEKPIELVQRFQASLFYTTPINYPEGWLEGYELEVRQDIGRLWSPLDGFSIAANATFIDSEVTLPVDEAADFLSIGVPISKRDMLNAPEHLYNFNLTYEHPDYGTQIGLFYTVRGDTLVEGGVALSNSFVPDVYEEEFGILNLGIIQPIGEYWKIAFQARNLTDPKIKRVHRSDYSTNEVTKSSYRRGIDFSFSTSFTYRF